MFNVLVVDDEVIERNCVKQLLGHFPNVEIFEAENGLKAIEIVKKEVIDIVITDIKMPFMDGLELAKNINELNDKIKIVVISAFGEFEYAKQAIKYGANEYLLKPLDIEEFLNIIKKLLNELKLLEESDDIREVEFFSTTDINSSEEVSNLTTDEIIDNINYAVSRNEKENIKVNMDLLFLYLINSGGLSSLYVRHLCLEIIKSAIETLNIKNEERLIDVADQIRQIQQFTHLKEYVINILIDILNEHNLGANAYHRKLINTILDIINQEYQSDLSLEILAKRVYLSSSYISSMFKKETGENVVKYLTDFRLKKAKELLDTTNMKISDVRKQTGFSNDSYFITLFKKQYGNTPAQYKEGRL